MASLLVGWCSLALAATEGQPAPAIQAKLLDGTAFNLADEAGKVVIVNMWATWCAPCREEMPALEAYYREHREQGLVLVALSMDDPRDEAKVREATRAYSFPVGFQRDAYLKGYGRIWRLPLTFVVDRNGILRKDQWYGDPGLDVRLLEQTVTPLLRTP
ncbi:MAG TPA: TlpA disulfide reductase family protein [Usitatibacter sp.]|nr:TlpA disulfide reductase family protein [Usitatibacter sp.]